MADDNAKAQSEQEASKPNPMLNRLDRLVGTWTMNGHEFGTDKEMDGQVTFEWMEGGHFLKQQVELGSKGIEIIGYNAESKSLKSHYFGNQNRVLEYEYELLDDNLTVSIDMPGVKGQFTAKFSDDGNSYTGRWEWTEDGVKMGYDATMTRVK